MTINELADLGSVMIKHHPAQKDLISIAVNDAFMDCEDDDPRVQKLADWIMSICQSDTRVDPVDPATLESFNS
jgi:hypothetical protein